jgi:uncharacterized protein YkwD
MLLIAGGAAATAAPADSGARFYTSAATPADEAAVPRDPLRDAILEGARALAKRARRPSPERDARLDAAMNEVARAARAGEAPATDSVEILIRHHGIVDPPPAVQMVTVSGASDGDIRSRVVSEIADLLRGTTAARIGVGIHRAGDKVSVVVAVQSKEIDLEPVPRQLALGESAIVAGTIATGYREPGVVVAAPDGRVHEQAPLVQGRKFRGQITCAAKGRYQVEVTAVDPGGPAVLANFPVFCGEAPPPATSVRVAAERAALSAPEAERRILALVNRDRAAAGLPAVVADEGLAAVARAHSRDMAEHDFVAHVSPRTGNAVERLRRAGLAPELLLENVGRAYSADEAESGFLGSPGHRGNILEPRARRLGVGVVLGKPVAGTTPLFVTQLLTN